MAVLPLSASESCFFRSAHLIFARPPSQADLTPLSVFIFWWSVLRDIPKIYAASVTVAKSSDMRESCARFIFVFFLGICNSR